MPPETVHEGLVRRLASLEVFAISWAVKEAVTGLDLFDSVLMFLQRSGFDNHFDRRGILVNFGPYGGGTISTQILILVPFG